MIRRSLPGTDLVISAVGLGAFPLGGWMWGEQSDDDSRAALHAACEAGVNWIDTAPIYGDGRADRLIGAFLRECPPSRRPLVFTKFGHHLVDGRRVSCGSRAQVESDCDRALRDLGVERIDLFQQHWPAPEPVEEAAAACAALIKAGKVRAVGLCNADPAYAGRWLAADGPLHCLQVRYSLLAPEAAQRELPWCAERGLGCLAYAVLHRGLLSGAWDPKRVLPAGDFRAGRSEFNGPGLAAVLAAVEELRAIGEDDELGPAQLAVGALLCTEGLTACIIGARNAAQARALGELAMPLRHTQLEQVEAVAARLRSVLAGGNTGT